MGLTALIAYLGWPLVTLALFLVMSTQRALIWSLLGAYLILPAWGGFDFPGIPRLDKYTISNLATFFIALGLARSGMFRWPRSTLVNLLMAIFVFSPILTSFTNHDPISIGDVYLPPMTLYTAISMCVDNATALMPFILGAALLRDEKSHRELLLIYVLCALAYSLPILLEVVKGPFLQAVIYKVGAPPGYYLQQMRGGGFRAVVFLGHGLIVSAFLGMAVLAALGLWRGKQKVWGVPALLCGAYLFAVLILNKSLGALILATLLGLLLMFLKPRRFILVALGLALIVTIYPAFRASGMFPVEQIEALSASYSKERAGSLAFRLRNEEMLLNRALERPMLGWGGFARNRVYVVQSWGETRDVTITDGTWIITLGMYGWLGYIGLFGLLSYPFLHLARMRQQSISPATVALAAMLAFTLLDLIPNSSLRPVIWLVAGALAGLPRLRHSISRKDAPVASPQPA